MGTMYLILTLATGVVAIPQKDMTECKKNANSYIKAYPTSPKPMCISGVK